MTTKEIWGPPLWRLLHGLAERLGSQAVPLLSTDERRAWVNLLRVLPTVMPCMACRLHFKEWSAKNPPERFLQTSQLRADARRWLWALHAEVNTERGVPSPDLDQMSELYGVTNTTVQILNEAYKTVITSFQLAVQQRLMTPDAFMTFKTRVISLRNLTG